MANEAGNVSAEWEGFILETMFKRVLYLTLPMDKLMIAPFNIWKSMKSQVKKHFMYQINLKLLYKNFKSNFKYNLCV